MGTVPMEREVREPNAVRDTEYHLEHAISVHARAGTMPKIINKGHVSNLNQLYVG